MRRISLILALVLGTALAFPLVARADWPSFAIDGVIELAPGDTRYWTSPVVILGSDHRTTIVFEGTSGFADDETVVATIALSTHDIDGLGSVELLSSPTITGTTPADWTTGGAVPFEFALYPWVELTYTAPSAEDLGCDDHPGEVFTTDVRVGGTLVGSKGTMATFAADDFERYIVFNVTCPVAASTSKPGAPAVTPPPTDTLPLEDATPGGEAADRLTYLVLLSGAAVVGVATRLPRSHRSWPSKVRGQRGASVRSGTADVMLRSGGT